jgi:hypothetical protein
VSVTPGEERVVPSADATDEPPLEWTDNPWRHNVTGAALSVAFCALSAYLLWNVAGTTLTFAALSFVLWVAMSPGFVPTRYRVDARGAARRVWFAWHRREWGAIRRAVVRHAPPFSPHVWLLTETRPGPLQNLRAVSLSVPRYLPDHDRLFRELRHRLALHGL